MGRGGAGRRLPGWLGHRDGGNVPAPAVGGQGLPVGGRVSYYSRRSRAPCPPVRSGPIRALRLPEDTAASPASGMLMIGVATKIEPVPPAGPDYGERLGETAARPDRPGTSGGPGPHLSGRRQRAVEALIDHFVARDRERFGMWIRGRGRTFPWSSGSSGQRGLPEELAYTAMIESGFSPRAVSRAGAKGMWQSIEATGRRYGLVIDRWLDERLDPVKSTVAAAQYLGDLYGCSATGLAQAEYERRRVAVGRAIRARRDQRLLGPHPDTALAGRARRCRPQILRGRDHPRPDALRFRRRARGAACLRRGDHPAALDFDTIAALAGVSIEQIRDLNPALLAGSRRPSAAIGSGYRPARAPGSTPRSRPRRRSSLPSWTIHRIGGTSPSPRLRGSIG